jgi:hypothetical protein
MRIVIVCLFLLLPACAGKHKAFCLDIQDGGMAHLELGYFYDSTVMTITGPTLISTTPDEMATESCVRVNAPS